ncbi:hypothetical protein FB567DRAFT_443038 [Paraphoma chrysanthemicola]|uniref:BTB domain-containing protein n=1 Tax=Paraphoma chrysanthemicola TaxID=798071 RepID=A0A8K0VZT7_9PLEO|nr:hypothetical protein FB567DRAFT_443038 [Paraphoma chrysanthemicola]
MGYCITYGLYPDPDDADAIQLAYANLPASATLSRFFVLSTIYFWSPAKHTIESGKLNGLHKRFILDVMVAQAQRGQPPNKNETKTNKTVPQLARHGLKNSCVFHEHLNVTEEECRCRLANSKFVFDALLNGCVKEADNALSMGSRQRPYFRGAFTGDFKEATEGVITLTDVSEQTFRVFLQWAHAQMFSSGSGALIPDPSILSPLPSAIAVASTESVKFENSCGDERPVGFLGKDSHNSCFLHEHLEHDKDACRKRISNKAHVFAVIIEACAKDGISMALEHIDT